MTHLDSSKSMLRIFVLITSLVCSSYTNSLTFLLCCRCSVAVTPSLNEQHIVGYICPMILTKYSNIPHILFSFSTAFRLKVYLFQIYSPVKHQQYQNICVICHNSNVFISCVVDSCGNDKRISITLTISYIVTFFGFLC